MLKFVPFQKVMIQTHLLRKNKKEKMLEFINNESKDFVDFKLSLNKDFKDDEDKKVSLIKNILKSISLIPDTLKQEIYIKKLVCCFRN